MPSGSDELLNVLISHYRNGTLSLRYLKRMHSYLNDTDYLPLPSDSDIWKTTGNIFFKEKNYEHALNCYKNAVTIDRTNMDALHNIGITFRVTGRPEDAKKVFAYVHSVEQERLAAKLTVKQSIPVRSGRKKYGSFFAISVIALLAIAIVAVAPALLTGNSENTPGVSQSSQGPAGAVNQTPVPTPGPSQNNVQPRTMSTSPVQATTAAVANPGGNAESGLVTKRLNYISNGNRNTLSFNMSSMVEDQIQSEPEFFACYRNVNDPSPCTEQETQPYLMKYINDPIQDQGLDQFIGAIRQKSPDRNSQAKIAISIVQNIPYDTSKSQLILTNPDDVEQNHPYETLFTDKGVCIDKSLLLAYTLDKLGFDTVIFTFTPEKHAAVGVKCDPEYAYKGTGYCFVETTGPAIITDSSGSYVNIGRLTSMPQIYHISNGSALSEIDEEYNDAKRFNELEAMGRANGQVLDPLRYADWKSLVDKYGLKVN